MNAESDARRTAKQGALLQQEPLINDYGQFTDDQDCTESQLNAISAAHYQERADLEVEALDDWERQHLGAAEDSDSDGQ